MVLGNSSAQWEWHDSDGVSAAALKCVAPEEDDGGDGVLVGWIRAGPGRALGCNGCR